MARYEAGETLSSIARTYDCSPPAISYVVSRSRARQPGSEAARPAPAGESQLIKAAGNGAEPASHREPASSPANAPAEVVLPHPGQTPEAAPVYASPTPPQAAAPGEPRSEIRPGHGTSHGSGSNGVEQPRWIDRAPQSSDPRASDPRASEPRTAAELFARPSPVRPPESQSTPQPAHSAANGDQHRPAPHASANGDPRGRLHLSLGSGNGSHPNGGSHPAEPRLPERQPPPPLQHSAPQHPSPQDSSPQQPAPQHSAPSGNGERPSWATPASQHQPAAAEQPYRPANQHPTPAHNAAPPNGAPGQANGAHAGNPEPRKEASGSYIDRELRARVDGDIAAFLAAFDGALAEDTPDSRTALREATDRLLRAGARTRIELERLEARLPLPPRDTGRQGEPAWRQR